jgi:hypothetical protein
VYNNDLSNFSAPILLFNFERVVCEEYQSNWRGQKYKLNFQNINAINQLFIKDFRILYLTMDWPDRKLTRLEDELDLSGCMFNGMMKVKDIHSLLEFLRHNMGSHYYDTDRDTIQALGRLHASLWQGYLVSLWGGNA